MGTRWRLSRSWEAGEAPRVRDGYPFVSPRLVGLISPMSDAFRIKDFEVRNRLFVGTGKYASYELMQQALEASGCQVVTVAVRRERLVDKQGRSLLDYLDLDRYVILPNTAGCFSADDAIRVSLLGRDLL